MYVMLISQFDVNTLHLWLQTDSLSGRADLHAMRGTVAHTPAPPPLLGVLPVSDVAVI